MRVKKRAIGILNKNDDCYILEFYERNAIKTVLTEFLDMDIAEFSKLDPLLPFIITVSMKNLDDYKPAAWF